MKTQIKNILNVMLVCLIIMIMTTNIQAQQRRQQGPPPTPSKDQINEMVEDLSKTLSLTDKQEKQVSELHFDHFADVEKSMKSGRPDRKVMESMKKDFEREILLLLNKDQQDLYNRYLKKQKKKIPQRPRR